MTDLISTLEAAAVHPELKQDLLGFLKGNPTSRLAIEGHAPRVKVERVLTQLFQSAPQLAVDAVRIRGRSGCSDFTGELVVRSGEVERRFAFTWCCAWRAEQQGWRDCFGFWDQGRAAREFGWDCFQRWEAVES